MIFPFLLLIACIHTVEAYPACASGLTCGQIVPPNMPTMAFDCAWVRTVEPEKGFVYFMHGNDGLRSKGMFFDTMLNFAPLGFSGMACDQRGYSPDAAPDEKAAYHYDILVSDIFSLVNATGYADKHDGKFHIVAHDQGARVTWHGIALGELRQKLLSFTTLSIPHADVFSESLYGPDADHDQQTASQYVRQLVLPNSTTVNNNAIWKSVCKSGGWSYPQACQKSLWWYNGAIDSGAMALAPFMVPYDSLTQWVGVPEEMVKSLTTYPLEGVPQTVRVGLVSEFPVLYACGGQDTADLCKQVFADLSAQLVTSKYTYVRLDSCGHNMLGCGNADEVRRLQNAIAANIQSAL